MSDRLTFVTKCPYCGKQSGWLFAVNETGSHIVDCEHCGATYVMRISVAPQVDAVYTLTLAGPWRE